MSRELPRVEVETDEERELDEPTEVPVERDDDERPSVERADEERLLPDDHALPDERRLLPASLPEAARTPLLRPTRVPDARSE